MTEEQYNRNITIDHLVGKEQKQLNNYRRIRRFSRVIKSKDVNIDPEKKFFLSQNDDGVKQDLSPAIIIEKNEDRIYRIVVNCPCGRHAAVVCEYDDEDQGLLEAGHGELS